MGTHKSPKKILMHGRGMLLNVSTKFHPNRMKKFNPGDNWLISESEILKYVFNSNFLRIRKNFS
jgi:hypothetical protein